MGVFSWISYRSHPRKIVEKMSRFVAFHIGRTLEDLFRKCPDLNLIEHKISFFRCEIFSCVVLLTRAGARCDAVLVLDGKVKAR